MTLDTHPTPVAAAQQQVTNRQVEETLEQARQVPHEIHSKVSAEGKQVAEDVDRLLEHSQAAIQEKNPDEQVQKALHHVQRIRELLATPDGRAILAMKPEGLAVPWDQLVQMARLMVSEAEFRALLADALGIARDMVQRDDNTTVEGKGSSDEVEKENAPDTAKTNTVSNKLWAKLTEEERDRLLDRVFGLLAKVAEHPDYRPSIEWLLQQAKFQGKLSPEDRLQGEGQLSCWREIEREGQLAWSEVKSLLENWSTISLDTWLETWRELGERLKDDEGLKHGWQQLYEWLEQALKEPAWLKERERRKELVDRTSALAHDLDSRYRVLIRRLTDESAYWLDAMRRDSTVEKLSDDLDRLMRDLFLDAQGRFTIKANLLYDLQTVLPAILRRLRNIHIPDVHSDDGAISLDAEGIEVSIGEMAPKQLHLEFLAELEPKPRVGVDVTYGSVERGRVHFTQPSSLEADENLAAAESVQVHSVILFEVLRIHSECRNVRFRLEKRTFPQLLDHGLADLRIFDRGMSLHFLLHPDAEGGGSLRVHRVHCHIHDMGLRLHSTQHDWLYTVIGPYVRRIAKEKIEKAIEDLFPLGPITLPSTETIQKTFLPQ